MAASSRRRVKPPEIVTHIPRLPARGADANKGSCGRVLVVGGSRGMAGAPCLVARAAYRAGAGLVRVLVPEPIWDVVASKLDECTTFGLPATEEGTFSELAPAWEQAHWADVLALGPGIGSHSDRTMSQVCTCADVMFKPMVLDADGLNAFGNKRIVELGRARTQHEEPPPLVITPHPGEMARLLSTTVRSVQKDREAAAICCQKLIYEGVVVLKGAGTIVTDGKRIYVNTTGNSGMATGGTGDVLTGIIAAFLGQGMKAFDAAVLGVYLHGLAGDLAVKRTTVWGLIASDLIGELPRAMKAHLGHNVVGEGEENSGSGV